MTKLILMVGIPASGKSTYIQNHITPKDKVISRDNIRFDMVSENFSYFSKEKEVFNEYVRQAQDAIESKKYERIYLDATHLNEKSRNKILNKLNLKGVSLEAIYFDLPIKIVVERNNKRIGRYRVPDKVMQQMADHLTCPSADKKYKYKKVVVINK